MCRDGSWLDELWAADLGLKTQGFRIPSLRDWLCVRMVEQPRSGDSCQPRVFNPRFWASARRAASRGAATGGER
jgi:hypothetical protein